MHITEETLKGVGARDSGKKVEFEVELQGSRIEPTVDRHTRENPGNKDEEQANEEPQHGKLCSGSREQDDMTAYAFAIVEEENTPARITFQEEINSSENDEWVLAMEEDMSSLKKNHTWELKARHKARLVAQGFTQQEGIDYNETTFLHGNLEETIYMRQPLGFEEGTSNKDCPSSVCDVERMNKVSYNNVVGTGLSREILGIEIVSNMGSQTLKVPQLRDVQKLLNKFRVDNSKSVSVSLGAHFNVSLKECPSSVWNVKIMRKVSYAKVVDTLMYLIFLGKGFPR
nr:hypothetical protein [Tanacetum cinerariifolium]